MRRLIAALACAFAGSALAQAQATLVPSKALGCLTPAEDHRGLPDYPFNAFKAGERGRVSVELVFSKADARPEVNVLSSEGDETFVDSVERHVKAWRVPCLSEVGGTARLQFDFVFKPDDRKVHSAKPVDAEDAARKSMLACVKHLDGSKSPEYPASALRRNVQGRVWAELRYESADRAPVATFHARPSATTLVDEVQSWVSGLRMPCHQGVPVVARAVFEFHEEGRRFGFMPGTGFRFILSAMRAEDRLAMPPDTTAMSCPFDVRLTYLRPDQPNKAMEVGSHDPARRPLLEWLRQAQFAIPDASLDAVYGDQVTFQVPCLKVASTPQPGTKQ